ncbi:MAG TPA: oligoribonuclease, partial [Aquella sp.]|nr:oligoribonuclease [Aquella sp.]
MPDPTSKKSKKQNSNLIWLDMEMTGLSVEKNVIIEVAVVITDSDLNILDETPSYVIHQSESELKKMDKWNVGTHTKSGLLEKVRESSNTTAEIEAKLLKFIKKYTYKGQSPLCGNTIHQDRKFLVKYMPKLAEYFHYRNLDVST